MDCHVIFLNVIVLQQNYFDMRSKVRNYLQDVVVYLENSNIPYNLLCLKNLFKTLKYLPKFFNFFCAFLGTIYPSPFRFSPLPANFVFSLLQLTLKFEIWMI